jgi:hypothetical protein
VEVGLEGRRILTVVAVLPSGMRHVSTSPSDDGRGLVLAGHVRGSLFSLLAGQGRPGPVRASCRIGLAEPVDRNFMTWSVSFDDKTGARVLVVHLRCLAAAP